MQVGHGREEIAEALKEAGRDPGFFPLWSYATPPAIELAKRRNNYAPAT